MEVADTAIERLLSEARQAREAAEETPAAPAVSFDGGVRGRRPVAPAAGGLLDETAGSLFARAMQLSIAERSERTSA